ncbi:MULTISPECIES: hypothetical protein [Atopobiaceae]|uniref:hypothetical protein n=1 Tax=Atopobiaceae TaxID=1643824 RepID=UPI00034E1C0C|nr:MULTISPECIES: hypothetical protein [Atopobiaceae]EPD78081.1 hypothetical protein HMPREF1527_00385 [Atopobium sp. oral taxon 199 str. F0494]
MGAVLVILFWPIILIAAIFGLTIQSLEALVNSWAFPIAILIFVAWLVVTVSLIRTFVWWLKDRKNHVVTKKRFCIPITFSIIALALTFFDVWLAVNVVSAAVFTH